MTGLTGLTQAEVDTGTSFAEARRILVAGHHVVARLRELATQDRRIVHGGHVQAFIRDDDQLRAAIRDLVRAG